jgi:polar amino acid transport system substrate-binding protein
MLLLSICGSGVQAQEPVIHAYTQLRSPADRVTDAEGRVVPVDMGTRLFHALMVEAGLDYDITLAPWARNIQALDNQPNVLAYTFVRSAEREDKYYWVGLVQNIQSYLYGLKENQANLPTSLEQARNYRIGSIRDDAYDNLLHDLGFPHIVHINNSSPWLTLMERGRIDLVPYSELAISNYLAHQNQAQDRLLPVVELEALSTGLYFALSKHSDEAVFQRLRQAYIRMVASGEYQRVVGQPHPTLPNSLVTSGAADASN